MAFVSAAESGNSSGTSLAAAKPASTAVGDAILAVIWVNSSSVVVGAPGGWTPLASQVQDGAAPFKYTAALFGWVDDGSAGPFSFTWGGSNLFRIGLLVAYRGDLGPGPFGAASLAKSSGSSTAMRGPSIATGAKGSTVVMLGVSNAGTFSATPPGGMAERFDSAGLYCADLVQSAAGASGNKDATLSSADYSVGGLVELLAPQPPAPGSRSLLGVGR